MGELDKGARKAFQDNQEDMEAMTPTYIMSLSSYRQDIIRTLKDAWFKHGTSADDNEITLHLDRVMARVVIHLTPEEESVRAHEPLLCGFMLDYAWSSMMLMEKAIAEVR
jgi:hypothetical protein